MPAGGGQTQLFAQGREQQNTALLAALDAVNMKEGKELLVVGSRLQANAWSARVDARSPEYTTRWSDVARVKAV